MLINWYRAKKAEWRAKAMFWGAIAGIVDNNKDIIELTKNLFVALKDVPLEDLQSEFVGKLAEIIHETNQKNDKK